MLRQAHRKLKQRLIAPYRLIYGHWPLKLKYGDQFGWGKLFPEFCDQFECGKFLHDVRSQLWHSNRFERSKFVRGGERVFGLGVHFVLDFFGGDRQQQFEQFVIR